MKIVSKLPIIIIFLLLESNSFAGKPAARQTDTTSGGGTIVRGSPTVLINNKSAARLGDAIITPRVVVLVPCVGGAIFQGSPTVLINNLPAARVGDLASTVCGPETIVKGSPNVQIGN